MRQSSSGKEHNLSLRLVLFFPFPLLFSWLSTYLFIDREIQETIPLQFPGCFSVFLQEILFEKFFSCWMSAKISQSETTASCKRLYKRPEFHLVRMSHTSVTCDWTYHFSHTWRNIVCSPDLPELICVWKTCDIVFWWVFLSMYIIKLYSHLCEQLYVCFVFPIQTTWCSLGNLLYVFP